MQCNFCFRISLYILHVLQAREMSQAEIDQQKRRTMKAQKARQAAIESLWLKREQRKQEVKRIAEQEIVMCYNYVVCTGLSYHLIHTSIRTSLKAHSEFGLIQ